MSLLALAGCGNSTKSAEFASRCEGATGPTAQALVGDLEHRPLPADVLEQAAGQGTVTGVQLEPSGVVVYTTTSQGRGVSKKLVLDDFAYEAGDEKQIRIAGDDGLIASNDEGFVAAGVVEPCTVIGVSGESRDQVASAAEALEP